MRSTHLRQAYRGLIAAEVGAEARGQLGRRLRALLADEDAAMPDELIPADALWAAALREHADTAPTPELAALVRHLASLTGPRPSQRWRRTCLALSDAASARGTTAETLRALAEDAPLCSGTDGAPTPWHGAGFHLHYVVGQNDGDLARGVVWAASLTAGPATTGHLTPSSCAPGSDVIEDLKLAGGTCQDGPGAEPDAVRGGEHQRAACQAGASRRSESPAGFEPAHTAPEGA
ncbi:hypothetical protein ABZ461_07920 [Actinacidiphila glaucinigra]|uniref:hypothetical protein n=1 Tax=Actinacidiphila glaucinigra TaxID=235986 RepID=UPI0033F08287